MEEIKRMLEELNKKDVIKLFIFTLLSFENQISGVNDAIKNIHQRVDKSTKLLNKLRNEVEGENITSSLNP